MPDLPLHCLNARRCVSFLTTLKFLQVMAFFGVLNAQIKEEIGKLKELIKSLKDQRDELLVKQQQAGSVQPRQTGAATGKSDDEDDVDPVRRLEEEERSRSDRFDSQDPSSLHLVSIQRLLNAWFTLAGFSLASHNAFSLKLVFSLKFATVLAWRTQAPQASRQGGQPALPGAGLWRRDAH